ncbi:MAG: pantetheine-phosphate adenylyltransferase [Oscillospiraceae bacterium]
MRIAICPGSFDPITYGHLDIIKRATKIFDKVIVLVITNPTKTPAFDVNKRVEMINIATEGIPNVEADSYDGLLVNYVKEVGACAIVKGLRATSDFEYEFQMALTNKKLCDQVETIFLTTSMYNMYLSSSVVRQVACYGGDLSGLVPKKLHGIIKERFTKE